MSLFGPRVVRCLAESRDKGLTLTPGRGLSMCGMNASTKHETRTSVSASGLRKAYGEKVVLDGVDPSIGEGEVFALLGPNGAGKTTTVKVLSTLIPSDAGTASVLGHDLRGEAGAGRAAIGGTRQFSPGGNRPPREGKPPPCGPPRATPAA